MKIVLLIFLFIFAYQDIKERSISVGLVVLYIAMWGLNFLYKGIDLDISVIAGFVLGLFCIAVSAISGEKIGLGDAAMIGIVGITVGGADTLWIWWMASVMACLFYIAGKYKNRLKATITIEASIIIPTVLIISVLLIDASIWLYKNVDMIERVNWDMSYQINQRRLVDKAKNIIGLEDSDD